jgi:hypothetical protein
MLNIVPDLPVPMLAVAEMALRIGASLVTGHVTAENQYLSAARPASVRASSSAASAVPIRWKISCTWSTFASLMRPVARAQRPGQPARGPHPKACRACGPGPRPPGDMPPAWSRSPRRSHLIEHLSLTSQVAEVTVDAQRLLQHLGIAPIVLGQLPHNAHRKEDVGPTLPVAEVAVDTQDLLQRLGSVRVVPGHQRISRSRPRTIRR